MFQGRYHSYVKLEGSDFQYEQCRDCHPEMSGRRITAILAACNNDIPYRITDGIRQCIELLDDYYGYKGRWIQDDLIKAMRDPHLKDYHKYGRDVVFEYVSGNDFNLMRLDPSRLDLVEKSESLQGYYSVPFYDKHALDGFLSQISHVNTCVDILQREWHVLLPDNKYVKSFDTLFDAKDFIQNHFAHIRDMIIYRRDTLYMHY